MDVNINTFVFPSDFTDFRSDVEKKALSLALNEKLGVVYALTTTDQDYIKSIKEQCEDAGKKVFCVSFTEEKLYHGLNPFLNLSSEQIAEIYFKCGSKEHKELAEAFKSNIEPVTPKIVLKILCENESLFVGNYIFYAPIIENLKAITSSTNPFSNTDKSKNVDLVNIINEGHVLILGGINDPILGDEFKAFINDYYLKPLFKNDQIDHNRSNNTYFIVSSYSAIDRYFIEELFSRGRSIKIQGLYTEYRHKVSSYTNVRSIYDNSQARLDLSENLNPNNINKSVQEHLKFHLNRR